MSYRSTGRLLRSAYTERELLHQAEVAARQEMRLRFFRKREAAAWRQMMAHNVWRPWAGNPNTTIGTMHDAIEPGQQAVVEAARVQRHRNKNLGVV